MHTPGHALSRENAHRCMADQDVPHPTGVLGLRLGQWCFCQLRTRDDTVRFVNHQSEIDFADSKGNAMPLSTRRPRRKRARS